MQRRLFPLAATLTMALVYGSGAMAADGGEGHEPSVAAMGAEGLTVPQDRKDVPIAVDRDEISQAATPTPVVEAVANPPRDLKDIAIAAKPKLAERRPAVTANPKHPKRLVLSLVTGVTGGTGGCVILRSSDGGRTWSEPVPLPDASGAPGGICYYSDVAYAPDGTRVYAAYTDGPVNGTVLVSSSTDDGATWQKPAVAMEDLYDERSFLSPSIATPVREADAKWVYLIAQSRYADPGTNISFTRSGDRGLGWSPERGIAGGDSSDIVSGGRLAGGLDGEVAVVYFESDYGVEPGVRIRRSSDHGSNFDGPAIAARGYAGDSDVKIGNLGVAQVAFPSLSEDFYHIAYVWSPGPPYTTWSEPVTINDGGFRRNQSAPSLALQRCGTTTVLHLIWKDARLSPSSDSERYQDVFYARKLAKPGATWSNNIRISDRSSFRDDGFYTSKPPELAVSVAGRLFAVWTDRRDKTDPADPETDAFGSTILSGITCP